MSLQPCLSITKSNKERLRGIQGRFKGWLTFFGDVGHVAPLNGTRAGEETRLLYGGENETLPMRLVLLHRFRLLAQEGAALLSDIQCHH